MNEYNPAVNIRRTTVSPPSNTRFGKQDISDVKRVTRMSGLTDRRPSDVSAIARAHMTSTMRGLSRAMMRKGY